MNMAASEPSRRSVQLDHGDLRLERVESVTPDATVRHVDQLDSDALEAVYEAISADRPVPAAGTGLEPGEVIVFTDYFRVERV
ncbi:hypothetical protein ACFR99_07660 [Haloarchaeobius amylolyticus]|uniref:DUF7979 domain-containing protein n=1 Tax=Haloarchaeobius amylolyticus TaxID=1198296 RepID=A0ABD6BEC2_9EURY